MPLSRKDFNALAAALASTRPETAKPIRYGQWAKDTTALASALASTNPRFDRRTFLAACGLTPTQE